MTIEDHIKNIPDQFKADHKITNADRLERSGSAIVAGMGGSHLGAHLFQCWQPIPSLSIHSDFGLPPYDGRPLIIACSYSGRTAETQSAVRTALDLNLPVLIAAAKGPLLELAVAKNLAYIDIGPDDLLPRLAIGYFFKILADYYNMTPDVLSLDLNAIHSRAKEIAPQIKDSLPIILSSNRNYIIPLNARAQLTETALHPVFDLYLPEANHNQLAGIISGAKIGLPVQVIIFTDNEDNPELQESTSQLVAFYQKNNIAVLTIEMTGSNRLSKLVSGIILTDFIGLELARLNNVDELKPSLIDEFKLSQ